MGWRYRKSVNLGPFRLNFSKSGIGYSVGGKFFRVTKKATGGVRSTTTIPGLHLSKVTEYGAKQARAAKVSSGASGGRPKKSRSIAGIVVAVLLLLGGVIGCSDNSSAPDSEITTPVQQEQVDEQAPQTDAETQPDEMPGEIQTQPEPDPTPTPDPVVEQEPAQQEPQPTSEPQPEPEPQPEQSEPVSALTPEQAFRESLKQYAYVGSSESDKYHKPTCRWTSKINNENLVHFGTVDEAKAAGYEPCGTCKPK